MIRATDMLRRTGRTAVGVLPAALLAELGMPALGAVVFLAIVVLAMICWVIASGDRTNRVSQMMLAHRGQADCLVPGTAVPSMTSDAQAGRPDRPAPGLPAIRRRASHGCRCPLGDRSSDTPKHRLAGSATCGNAVS